MRLSEIEEREDFLPTLCTTLSTDWSRQFSRPIDVTPVAHSKGGQIWFRNELLSAFYIRRPDRSVRHFLRDGFRVTHTRGRRAAQWMLGTLAATPPGLAATSRAALRVTPPIPHAWNMLVIPGNRRVRTFDFARGVTRAIAKHGFPPNGLLADALRRAPGETGPFRNITAFDSAGAWLEEDIADAIPLPRLPHQRLAQRCETIVLQALLDWQAQNATFEAADLVAERARGSAVELAQAVEGKTGEARVLIEWLAANARRAGTVALVNSHGDAQPGNVLVERRSNYPFLIDWEYTARRSSAHDVLVYATRAVFPRGLAQRLFRFVEEGTSFPTGENDVSTRAQRLSMLALALLELLQRRLEDEASCPFLNGEPASALYLREIETFMLGTDR